MQDAVIEAGESAFLTVPELADLLHVNEKKIYQLANNGELPGTKITGKWIFPRRLVEDWIIEHSHGGVLGDRLLLGGSDDALLRSVCKQAALDYRQQALISYSPCGTRHGLSMLDKRRVDGCFINWGAFEPAARRHLGLLRCYSQHSDWVLVRVLRRSQGILLSPALESTHTDIAEVINDRQLCWAGRIDDSGAHRNLLDLCQQYQRDPASLHMPSNNHTERSAAAALSTGEADVTMGSQTAARAFRLGFLPHSVVSIDLVVRRRSYFMTLMQAVIRHLASQETATLAESLGGYEIPTEQEIITLW